MGTELKMNVIIDWHSIGDLKAGLFQDPMYITSLSETNNFWRTIANHFSGNNTVAFYELFNEPTTYRGQLGSISWSDWKKINEDLIKIIKAFDEVSIPLVGGFIGLTIYFLFILERLDAQNIGYELIDIRTKELHLMNLNGKKISDLHKMNIRFSQLNLLLL